MNNYIESIFVDVSPHPLTQNKSVTLGVIYRPPNTDVRNFHENMSTILVNLKYREGHGAMVRALRSADVATCRAVSNPAWCRIFREISCFSPLNLGTLLRCCVLGQGTSPSNASLDSGENGRTEMAMCTISSMRRNGCRTVCSPWS